MSAPTNDPFATPPAADPFADVPAAPAQPTPEPTPPAPPAEPQPTAADMEPTPPPAPDAPPIVNADGEPVVPQPPAEPAPTPPPAPAPTPEPSPEPVQPPAPAPEPAAVVSEPANGNGTGSEPAAPAAPASSNGGATESTPTTPPKAGEPPKGYRHYVVLYQTGPTTFELANLQAKHAGHKDYVVKVTEPAEKEGESPVTHWYLQARNNDHAYRLCFTLFDRPSDGITVLPLPKASWRPRRVAPAPPAPERERLVIS